LSNVEDRTIALFVRAAEVDPSAIRSRLRRQRYDARSEPARPVAIPIGVSHTTRIPTGRNGYRPAAQMATPSTSGTVSGAP